MSDHAQQESIRLAAAALGKKGGMAGRGDSKRRSTEHYRMAGLKSVEVRRAKRDIKRTA
jgi:hypothetical protein